MTNAERLEKLAIDHRVFDTPSACAILGDDVSHLPRRLVRRGRLAAYGSGSGRYYIPSLATCVDHSVSEFLSRPLGPQGLFQHLAVLHYVASDPERRVRMTAEQLRNVFGFVPAGVYVLVGERTHRTYVPGPLSSNRTVLDRLEALVEAGKSSPRLKEFLADRTLGYLVLVNPSPRVERLRSLVAGRGLDLTVNVRIDSYDRPALPREGD